MLANGRTTRWCSCAAGRKEGGRAGLVCPETEPMHVQPTGNAVTQQAMSPATHPGPQLMRCGWQVCRRHSSMPPGRPRRPKTQREWRAQQPPAREEKRQPQAAPWQQDGARHPCWVLGVVKRDAHGRFQCGPAAVCHNGKASLCQAALHCRRHAAELPQAGAGTQQVTGGHQLAQQGVLLC